MRPDATGKGKNVRIDGIGLALVTVESDHGELGLHLAGIDSNDTDSLANQLLAETVCERTDGGLGGAVDAAAGVGLAAGNGANVDDVAGTFAVVTFEEDGENGLGHVDQTSHVGRKHDIDVLLSDLGRLGHALDQTTVISVSKTARMIGRQKVELSEREKNLRIIDEHIDLLELGGEVAHK